MIAEAEKLASELRVYPHLRDSDVCLNSDFSGQVLAINFGNLQSPIFLPQGSYAYQFLDIYTDPSNYFINRFFPPESNKTSVLLDEINALQNLEIDWDGEGSKPVGLETITRAKSLAIKLGRSLEMHGSKIDFEAGPGPKESIDFEHNDEDYFLINISSDSSKLPTFYARKKGGLELKGIFDIDNSSLMSLLLG